jgi:hypothetical protein
VTFADSVLHLVRAGARIDEPDAAANLTVVPSADASEALDQEQVDDVELAVAVTLTDPSETGRPAREYEPGMADIEAAVSLVATGLAKRVVLSGFPSWPGLLWRAYQLADASLASRSGVLILPTVVRPGGRVDIVITREIPANG